MPNNVTQRETAQKVLKKIRQRFQLMDGSSGEKCALRSTLVFFWELNNGLTCLIHQPFRVERLGLVQAEFQDNAACQCSKVLEEVNDRPLIVRAPRSIAFEEFLPCMVTANVLFF